MIDWMNQLIEQHPWLVPLSTIAVGVGLGAVVRKNVFSRLKRLTERPTFGGVALSAVGYSLLFWFGLLGAEVGLQLMTLPEHVQRLLQTGIVISITVSVALTVGRGLAQGIRRYSNRYDAVLPATFLTQTLVALVAGSVAILVILGTLGVSITPMITTLGIGGLAVALALPETLANLFAGMQIMLGGLVRPGDFVRLEEGREGYVHDIAWRHTRVRLLANNMIVIPNAKLAQSAIVNYYQPAQGMAVVAPCGVNYGSDLEAVERVTVEKARWAMQNFEGGVSGFEPFVRFQTFGDSGIQFSVILRVREAVNQYLVQHEFVKRLKKRYDRERIAIPWPIRQMAWREGSGAVAGKRDRRK
jgi:small-conductance mechanosensitive channel